MTTTERRLAQLEAALTPAERIKAWLAEAHAHGSVEAYSGAIYDQGPDALPLDRLAREAKEAAQASSRGPSREDRETAWRTAVRETMFRFHLVFRTLTLAHEALDRETLIHAALSAHCVLLANDDKLGRSAFPSHEEGLVSVRAAALARVGELHALEEARRRVEVRYFDGAPILFPATIRQWDEQRQLSERLAVSAMRLAVLDGMADVPTDQIDYTEDRVIELVADHVEHSRVTTLEIMDEGRRAITVAMRWLRPKLGGADESVP